MTEVTPCSSRGTLQPRPGPPTEEDTTRRKASAVPGVPAEAPDTCDMARTSGRTTQLHTARITDPQEQELHHRVVI